MSQQTVTLELPEESLKTLDEIAANMEVDRAAVLREAIALYLADFEALKSESEEAEREIAAGRYLTQDEMEARFEARIRRTEAA